MTAEFEIFRKDLIKINLYKEAVLEKSVSLDFFLDNNDVGTDYLNDIHNEDFVMNRYGCFNISEDRNEGYITIRPALIKFSLKISIICSQPFSEHKAITIYRNGKTEKEKEFDITANCNSIELIPENEKYILKIDYADNFIPVSDNVNVSSAPVQNTAQQTVEVPVQNTIQQTIEAPVQNTVQQAIEAPVQNTVQQPVEASVQNEVPNNSGISPQKMNAIKTESEKDYEQYAQKLENIKEESKFDKSILEYYKDHDLVPIEKIFAELDEKLKAAEEQIKLFIEARQNKTKEIEE